MGVGSGVVGAAGFFDGGEFHDFDAGLIGIEEGELAFAVAASDGSGESGAAGFQELGGFVDIRNAEGDVILDAKFAVIGVGGNVEHVFDPIVAVRDLIHEPVYFGVGAAAFPIQVETEEVFIEFVFEIDVVGDEAGVDDFVADGGIGAAEFVLL